MEHSTSFPLYSIRIKSHIKIYPEYTDWILISRARPIFANAFLISPPFRNDAF